MLPLRPLPPRSRSVKVVHSGRRTCHAISGRGDQPTGIPDGCVKLCSKLREVGTICFFEDSYLPGAESGLGCRICALFAGSRDGVRREAVNRCASRLAHTQGECRLGESRLLSDLHSDGKSSEEESFAL